MRGPIGARSRQHAIFATAHLNNLGAYPTGFILFQVGFSIVLGRAFAYTRLKAESIYPAIVLPLSSTSPGRCDDRQARSPAESSPHCSPPSDVLAGPLAPGIDSTPVPPSELSAAGASTRRDASTLTPELGMRWTRGRRRRHARHCDFDRITRNAALGRRLGSPDDRRRGDRHRRRARVAVRPDLVTGREQEHLPLLDRRGRLSGLS